jgi:hypothetical protein
MNLRTLALPAAALIAVLALAGCKKKEAEAPATPPAAMTTPAPAPAPSMTSATPPPMAEPLASVASLDLGSAAGADMKITAPKTTFAPKDKIIAAVTTRTRDPNATVPSKLSATWTHTDSNQTVNEESRDLQLKGEQVYDFAITNPSPWPAGNYRVDIKLDGNVVQTHAFEVK